MVLQDPRKLQEFNLEKYKEEIIMTGQLEMCTLADFIVSELREPMKDPRAYRTIANANPSPDKLFYMLIEESEQTFKRGMIVTATVLRVFEGKDGKDGASFALCKLDNGLEARVDQKNIDNQNRRRLEDLLSTGAVLTGRIDLIKNENEERFSVILNCQPKVLESHKGYVEGMDIPEEDLLNTAFKQAGPRDHQQRFIHRRITHPNFKNVTSQKALQVLQDEGQENGEFIFRPSSKGINNITLTWKFFFNNYVHADI
jgi:transcription elongation factor SPT6